MQKISLIKKGISMVALVITIIVLIILTSAVVITGVGTQKEVQFAMFKNNIDTVQELVSIKMSDNMITAAQEGYGKNYKWAGIAEGYTEEIARENPKRPVGFIPMLNGPSDYLLHIDKNLLANTTIGEEEATKYYVSENGTVYYEGFEYEGQTYYNQDTVVEGTEKEITPATMLSRTDIQADPTKYYGAYVNYTDENGEPFKTEDGTAELEWRIFYADRDYIYLTPKGSVGSRSWPTRNEAIDDLTMNKMTYVNPNYARWSNDGMSYEMYRESYNQVKDNLTATQTDLYRCVSTTYYWLSTPATVDQRALLMVNNRGTVSSFLYFVSDYYKYLSIRPFVCLKSDTLLVENNGKYDLIISPTDITVPTVTITADTEDETNATSITYTITFSENVINFTKEDICIDGIANTIDITGSGAVYTLVVPTTEDEYTQTVSIAENVCTDLSGNENRATSKTMKIERAIITIDDIILNPIEYYGEYVHYTDENGQPFKAEDGTTDLQWRIFYADEENIYITTSNTVGLRIWKNQSRADAIADLKAEKDTYKNARYAEWAKDGMEYRMFRDSYNTIVGQNAHNFVGSEEEGYANATNSVSVLKGTLQENLYSLTKSDDYWLASKGSGGVSYMLMVRSQIYLTNSSDSKRRHPPTSLLKTQYSIIEV